MDRIAIGTFTGPAGTFRQRTEITKAQRDILAQLKAGPLPRILAVAARETAPSPALPCATAFVCCAPRLPPSRP